jgi:predicted ATPase
LDGRSAEKHFNVKFLGEYHFKGFKHDQKAFALTGRKNIVETVYQGQLVGRNKELESLASFIEPLKQKQFAGVMVLKGEAGIGKSRLVHSFQYSEYFNDFPAHWVIFQADEILRLPLNPFTDWLKKRFELLEGQPDEVNWIAFSRNIQELAEATPDPEIAAELTRTSSVLAALINISVPNSLYENLDAKGRYDNTLIALSVLLRVESLQKPLILFMEDTHWLDEDSGAFLSYFVRTLLAEPDKHYPIAIIVTQRPEGDSVHMMDEVSMYGINLGRLSSANLSLLAEDVLGAPLADSLLALLNTRADGNPFFAEQILRYLSEQNALALDAEKKYFASEQAETSLPTDVRAVLVARLDQLTQQVKETVQTASVLGREFEVRVLSEMLHNDANFSYSITQAEKANIWTPLSEIEYIFRHALLRDAAYSMQLLTRQRKLHKLAAAVMETVYRDDLEPHYGELAYHAEKADIQEKALHYLSLAGKFSLSVYQNQQAIDYFTRALAFVAADDLRIKFDLMLLRVECYYNIGDSTAQLKDLDLLEKLAEVIKDDALLGRTYMRRAYCFSTLGDFQNVLTFAMQAKELSETAHDDKTLIATYLVLPNSLLRIGRTDEALRYAKEGLSFAKNANTLKAQGSALSILGLISLESEGPTIARQYQEQALVIARAIKDKYLEAMTLNNLANTVGLSQGDFFTARHYFEQAYSISHELGNIIGKGITLSNLGWLAGILGDYPAAIIYCEQALTVLRGAGNRSSETNIYINWSAVTGGQGNAREAFRWGQEALTLSKELGDRAGEAWSHFYLGYAYTLKNDFGEAVRSFFKSIEIRSEIKASALVEEARAGLIQTYIKMDDWASARIEMEHVLQYMEKNISFEGTEEPLRIFLAMYQVLEKTKDPRVTIVLQNAIQLLNTQVSKLRSEEARRMYVENVPWRLSIQQAAKANGIID